MAAHLLQSGPLAAELLSAQHAHSMLQLVPGPPAVPLTSLIATAAFASQEDCSRVISIRQDARESALYAPRGSLSGQQG